MPAWLNFSLYTTWVLAVFEFITVCKLTNLTKHENLQNLYSPFCILVEDFRLCSHYNNINYSAWHVYKPLFGFVLLLAHSLALKFHFQFTKKNYREGQVIGQT